MKRFTIVFTLLLVCAFAGTLLYVHASPDFTEPQALTAEQEDPDAPVWDMQLEDLLCDLEEKGLIDRSTEGSIACEGISTDARAVSGAEFYWWDVDNLEEGSDELEAYQSMQKDGNIDVWHTGYIMTLTRNGPFGVNLAGYTGDVSALEQAFQSFGH